MVGSAALGLSRDAPHLTDQEPATHVTVGTGRTQTRSYVFDIRRTSTTNSLITCDLTSQGPTQARTASRFVHDQAQHELDIHDIDEPLTWHPPPPANPDPPWPGIDPASVDPHRFAAAFAEHATAPNPVSHLRAATGMN